MGTVTFEVVEKVSTTKIFMEDNWSYCVFDSFIKILLKYALVLLMRITINMFYHTK